MSNIGVTGYTPTGGKAVNAPTGGKVINTPYEDEASKQVSVDNFLQLMIAQLKNQDFTNPVDDAQYVTQLAQFASMQQMQDLAYYSKSNYVMSLVGKEVTAATLTLGGNMKAVTGPVEKVALSNKEFMIFVDGQGYNLNQIMEINDTTAKADSEFKDVSKKTVLLEWVRKNEAKFRWEPAVSDAAAQKGMMYSVYYSEDEKFDTVSEVKKGILVGDAESTGTLEATIKGLEPGKTYFVNVVVKNQNGKEAVYQKRVITTKNADE
ncbi:MAG: flagellar hook capping FlgD N-terminal domain-containing protein [Hydrogenoanaerobacterium sp.]